MIEFIQEIFSYRFLGNAALAAVLSGIACGIVGTYIVSRRLVFMSGGITHASFGGIGIAYYLGANPLIGALVFAVCSAVGIEAFSRKGRISEDAATGVLWSLGMSVGIIFVFLTPGYAPNLMSFLFGNILLVDSANLIWLCLLDTVLILLFSLCYRAIVYTAFDREFAASQKLPVGIISHLMMILIAVTIVLNIKTMGIVLLMSLLTMPVVIAGTLNRNYKRITVWSCVGGALATLIGLYVSYESNIPSGAAAIAVLAVAYGAIKISLSLARKRKKTGAISRG
ncbi:MAG: metal ABC transporter permease [Rikenellaceae bacterium]|nr:metal ABC transporter permease [Rikenellaceae bacterium]